MKDVHTVIFDVGLTLLRPAQTFADVALATTGVTLDAPAVPGAIGPVWREWQASWAADGNTSPHLGHGPSEIAYWTGLYRQLYTHFGLDDVDVLADAAWQTFSTHRGWQPFSDVTGMLDDLDARGLRIGVLSNWGSGLRQILEHHDLLAPFTHVTVSGEIGMEKPDHGAFRHALDGMGAVAGPGVAYVGDSPRHDVAPAVELGMQAVFVDRWDRGDAALADEVDPEHDRVHRVTGLDQLSALLRDV